MTPPKVLLVHNFYQQPGGEDAVFRAERALLEAHGHEVHTYTASNDVLDHTPRLRAAAQTIRNPVAAREVAALVRRHGIEIVHVHNTFMVISPAIYAAARRAGAAVVQTLHNYRLLCANALLFRDGHVCEDCLGRALPLSAVQHACYRDSRGASAVVVAMQVAHRAAGTYQRQVDAYIALTDFARGKLIEGGLPEGKISVKPNFLDPDPGPGAGGGGYALFVGRLVPEKGLSTLLAAWETLGSTLPLKVVGEGPLAETVAAAAGRVPGVEYLGRQDRAEVLRLMGEARLLVFPSLWYEGFPMTIVEAFARGLPVVASDLGSMSTLIRHGVTGRHFRAGDPVDLAAQVHALLASPEDELRREVRRDFTAQYTAQANYRLLMGIYERALDVARQDARASTLTAPLRR